MKEYDFTIDDVRWYLSVSNADRLLTYREHPEELARLIWSGRLEKDLYDMEERYLRDLQSDLDRSLTDEPHVRQIFNEIAHQKSRRARDQKSRRARE